jgi:hypothetical protein
MKPLPQMKSFEELAAQFAESRRARLKVSSQISPNTKTERNAEIVWMRELGVPLSHIARIHNISRIRVMAIIEADKKSNRKVDEK